MHHIIVAAITRQRWGFLETKKSFANKPVPPQNQGIVCLGE